MTAAQIRQQFLDFFASKGHTIVPSAPIVLKNDPTLKFTNAGMNQFKDYFLGNQAAPWKRAADTQKCLRVSGKHNDLEEVGIDTYHHTMFEMLGNWSFGDYFKKEAIAWSWELLSEVYKIPKDRLYVTVFEGDSKENLEKDTEAYEFWKQFVAEDRILMGNKKDNFWEMGDTGPCGPCSEIHVDCRPDAERALVDGATLVNADHPQVIEIWNNVFMQFNRLKDKSLQPLPAQHVDTGMGFERLVRVLQQKTSNYDTDVFQPTIRVTETFCGKKYGETEKTDIAFRVIADHIRAICFAIADGQLPSNTDAGYVIRRILRRAVRYYYSFLDVKKPLLHELVPQLAGQFAHVFPELSQQVDFVKKVVFEEENSFLRTLEGGIRRVEDVIGAAKQKNIDGATAFELYDTYGFPYDLTALIASENGFAVDEEGFKAELQKQKDRSRAATALDMGDWTMLDEQPSGKFIGYTTLEADAKVLKYRKVKAKGKEQYQLVLDQTPFYAESGGQVGDTGVLDFAGETIIVTDTKKENDLIVHFTDTLPANVAAPVKATVNKEVRINTEKNHSATHLLHAALRLVLGNHVAQKGSLVNGENLRFDFSHFAKVTDEELAKIEAIVNEKIRENIPVVIKELPKEEALKLGAMALFGEKYGDVVRVVVMDPAYSVELCGGTHVGSTGELGIFKFVAESAVAAGVRRVEAVTGAKAEAYINEQFEILKAVKTQLKNPKDLAKVIENLVNDKAALEKQLAALELKQVQQMAATLPAKAVAVNGINFLGLQIEASSADTLRQLALALKPLMENFVVVLAAEVAGKAQVVVSIADNLVTEKGLDATKIIKEKIAGLIKGGGGGQKALASAGGQETAQLQQAIDAVKDSL
ncbi:alanine--tRNA ligase [Chitinophaga horti]|uniref:Alanine--tRNA ligase n=1 Tax=Chitinophaga horti TaxID=2920382 RepID=A0ABY6J0D9_9BACT|nr:alanine--tRNA ligase [Chitinophaga horti]UYQ93090.1 alanine--tRNA ligase [Chitinophaga horti]